MVTVRRLIRIALILLVVGVLANDGIRVGTAFGTASDALNAATSAALSAAAVAPGVQDSGRPAAEEAAVAAGGTLESYTQQLGQSATTKVVVLTISASAVVDRTILAAPILGLINKTPASSWYGPQGAKIVVSQTKQVDVYGSTP